MFCHQQGALADPAYARAGGHGLVRQHGAQSIFAGAYARPCLRDGLIAQHLQSLRAQRHKHVEVLVEPVIPVAILPRGQRRDAVNHFRWVLYRYADADGQTAADLGRQFAQIADAHHVRAVAEEFVFDEVGQVSHGVPLHQAVFVRLN